jgi:hypothetical protein
MLIYDNQYLHLSNTAATIPLHYISYLVLYRAFVAFPLIQETILNMDTTQRRVGLQHDTAYS